MIARLMTATTSQPMEAVAAPERELAGGPRAFASKRPLSRTELAGAPVRWPRPSRLSAPLPAPGRRAAAALEALGLRSLGDLLEHLPVDSREGRTVTGLQRGRAGDDRGTGAPDRLPAGPQAGDAPARRGGRVRRHRDGTGHLLQPAVAAGAIRPGYAAAVARQGRRSRRVPGLPPRARGRGGGRPRRAPRRALSPTTRPPTGSARPRS